MNLKATLVAAAGLAVISVATVYAQEATKSSGAEAGGIEEVIVTAQKRAENAQKTPAAVTALSGTALVQEGLIDLSALQNVIPGARFHQEGNNTQLFLRGIGSNLDFANVEPTVAFNFNGVFIPREGTSSPLFDLESVEVLPGPQGTLYGRGALGGAINANFRKPTHESGGEATLETGNYDLAHVTLAQNIAVKSDLAIRLAADYTFHSGFMTSGAYSKKDFAARVGVLYDPSDKFKLYIWGQSVTRDGHPANLVNKGTDPVTGAYSENAFLHDPWQDVRTPAEIAAAQAVPGIGGLFFQPVAENQKYVNYILGAQMDVKVGNNMTLTYIPSYFYLDAHPKYWLGVLQDDNQAHYNQVTQELRLSSESASLKWLTGVYAFISKNSGYSFLATDTAHLRTSDVENDKIQGIAGFGEVTYSVSSAFRLTAGGRYSASSKKADGIASVDQGNVPYTFDRTFNHMDVKAGFEYDISPTEMGYFTFQTGYQPGTFNETPATPTKDNLVKPAKLDSFTGGFKSRFMANRLQLNTEAFYYSYHDLLMQSYDQSKFYNEIFSAKKVLIYGDQLDITYKPTPSNQLSLSVSYVHARNKDFVTPQGDNYNGLQPPYAADWTIVGDIHHDFQATSGYLRLQADARYESAWFADFIHHRGTRQRPATVSNATVVYFSNSGKWTLGLWGKNLTNEPIIAATAAAGFPGPATAYMVEPRTYGLRGTLSY